MLPAKARLNRHQFTDFLKNPYLQVVFNHLGTFKYIKSQKTLISVVTSSKAEKNAVKRNKLRRRIYSLSAVIVTPFSGIVYVSKHAYGMEYSQITQLFNELLTKAHKNTK